MRTIFWKKDKVYFIDQTLLPSKLKYISTGDYRRILLAIKRMEIRGAPVIGVAAAYGMALAAQKFKNKPISYLKKIGLRFIRLRPTANSVQIQVGRMIKLFREKINMDIQGLKNLIVKEAKRIAKEDVEVNKKIGQIGAKLISRCGTVLTHCNAGSLATVEYGTALGVIRAACRKNRKLKVYATETRPMLQGARLTAFELKREGIPFALITDNMVGYAMKKGLVDAVVVGADRIAANGDVANKIGTYGIAVLAKEHGIPFYVAAPYKTIDFHKKTGREIKIEQRDASEVTNIGMVRIAPKCVSALNPAFDVTPKRFISAIITEKGVFYHGRLR